MKTIRSLIALVALLASGVARAEGETVATLPPVVVQTVPESGSLKVDAATTKEIRVTFSKTMAGETWSWSQVSKETFPQLVGKPRYLKDQRTCVVNVKLEPNRTYAVWINTDKFGNFKDSGGRSAVPYLLTFQTLP